MPKRSGVPIGVTCAVALCGWGVISSCALEPAEEGVMRGREQALGVAKTFARCDPAPAAPEGGYTRISETGLYCEGDASQRNRELHFYEPAFQLWADGADKRRYLHLPDGTQIDTSDMDGWVFPAGTRVWKEFSRRGRKLETRLLEKRQDGSWYAMAFVWDDQETDALAAPDGATDVRGTTHDVPAAGGCAFCHRGAADTVLGVSALQLAGGSHPLGVTLADLTWTGRLTDPPTSRVRFPGSPADRRALGYLHANCANCHGGARPIAGLNLSTSVHDGTVEDTQVYQTAIDQPLTRWTNAGYTLRIARGKPEESGLLARMRTRVEGDAMPPQGTEFVDSRGVAWVERWIESL